MKYLLAIMLLPAAALADCDSELKTCQDVYQAQMTQVSKALENAQARYREQVQKTAKEHARAERFKRRLRQCREAEDSKRAFQNAVRGAR